MATRASGFTIIETMLFLGLSALLLVGLISGVGSSINVQRYNDAAQTLKSTLQDQFSATTNVQNSRTDNFSCTSTGRVVERPAGDTASDQRGQSGCVMIGRYITIRNAEITSYLVTAVANPSPTAGLNDIQSLNRNYSINLARTNIETSELEWGTRIAWPLSGAFARPAGTARSIAILIVRSPQTGQVYAFSSDTVPAKTTIESSASTAPPNYIKDMIVAGGSIPGQGSRLICIEPNGLGIGHRTAVRIKGFASTATAVELISNEQLQSEGTRC
jgi:type II secretory pathway pseudopilin PulG